MKLIKIIVFICIYIISGFTTSCKNDADIIVNQIFDSIPSVNKLNPIINEISGIADSKINNGFLWAHADRGNPPVLYLVNYNGNISKTIFLKGVTNRDWEEMALFENHIYIAETGDNSHVYSSYKFYKFPEPNATTDTVYNIETINFTYPDGSHDSEAFIIDPDSKHIYIITKRDNPAKIYRLDYPYSGSNVVSLTGTLPYSAVVGAAISLDGKEIIIKTYTNLFYYKRNSNEAPSEVLKKSYIQLPYKIEPQGEAVCFSNNGTGFFTLSEKGFSNEVNLYFYKRK
jgi:hypothetical protein